VAAEFWLAEHDPEGVALNKKRRPLEITYGRRDSSPERERTKSRSSGWSSQDGPRFIRGAAVPRWLGGIIAPRESNERPIARQRSAPQAELAVALPPLDNFPMLLPRSN
jgi:hypothetical protein